MSRAAGCGWAAGEQRIDRLDVREIAAWRKTLPQRSAWSIHEAFRQVLHYAVRVGLLERNPAASGASNAEPKRREVPAFASPAEVDAVADELGPTLAAAVVFAAWTGLRPEEWIGLDRGDVDRTRRVVHVRRVFTDGQVKPRRRCRDGRGRRAMTQQQRFQADNAVALIDLGHRKFEELVRATRRRDWSTGSTSSTSRNCGRSCSSVSSRSGPGGVWAMSRPR